MSTTITARESAMAEVANRILAHCMGGKQSETFRIVRSGKPDELIEVPQSALRLFCEVLGQIAKGHLAKVMPSKQEFTSQEAADLLNVSRPYLIQLLEKGEIPYRKVGSKRRIFVEDVVAFKKRIEKQRLKTLEKLSSQAQELGMGYNP